MVQCVYPGDKTEIQGPVGVLLEKQTNSWPWMGNTHTHTHTRMGGHGWVTHTHVWVAMDG